MMLFYALVTKLKCPYKLVTILKCLDNVPFFCNALRLEASGTSCSTTMAMIWLT